LLIVYLWKHRGTGFQPVRKVPDRRSDVDRRIIDYIEQNPVKAKLVERPKDWPWSSARLQTLSRVPRGEPLREVGQASILSVPSRVSAIPEAASER
jgi:hypothetical protein